MTKWQTDTNIGAYQAIGGYDGTEFQVLKVTSGGALSTTATGSLTERSSAITAGNTSQQLCAANTARRYLFIQNPYTLTGQGIAAAESIYIRFGATAATVNTGTSIELTNGQAFIMENNYISTQAVQIIATTINHKFVAMEG